jgi:ethanolamine ammonia-lyase large subunit
MAPPTKRTEKQMETLARARTMRWNMSTNLYAGQNATMQFAFVLLTNGGRYAQIEQLMVMYNIPVPAQTAFYHAQKTIYVEIQNRADNSFEQWRDTMGPLDYQNGGKLEPEAKLSSLHSRLC